jgi:hypothetical protein
MQSYLKRTEPIDAQIMALKVEPSISSAMSTLVTLTRSVGVLVSVAASVDPEHERKQDEQIASLIEDKKRKTRKQRGKNGFEKKLKRQNARKTAR